jgi:hypothetical protein
MRLPLLFLALIILSCSTTKPDISPTKKCYLELADNGISKHTGHFFYNSENQLTKYSSEYKKLDFQVTYNTQKKPNVFELYGFNSFSVSYNDANQLVSANSTSGNFSFKYDNDNLKEVIVSNMSNIVFGAKKWTFSFDSQNGNIKKVYLSIENSFENKLIFEGLAYDDKNSISPDVSKNINLIRNLLNFVNGAETVDFDYLSKNNILSKNTYYIGEPLIKQEYTYTYNTEGYPTSVEYITNGIKQKVNYTYRCD